MKPIRENNLSNVLERDVDLLLLEEVQCNPRFAEWLRDRSSIPDDYELIGAWNSLATTDGESDLVVVYNEGVRARQRPDDEPFHLALMIENKIGAEFQPDQADRYRIRGEAGMTASQWSQYTTALLAPERYIKSMTGEHVFDVTITYEEIAQELASYGDARSDWRSEILRQAARDRMAHSRPIIPDQDVTYLMSRLHEMAAAKQINLELPSTRTWNMASASWYTFPKQGAPAGISLDHRASEGIVCLNVKRTKSEDITKVVANILPEGAMIEQRGMATIIFFHVESLDLTRGAEEQFDAYWSALRRAVELRDWAMEYRPILASIPRYIQS